MRTLGPLFVASTLALTGCAIAPTPTPSAVQGLAIQGIVHGGQQPVVGTHVYLLAANTTGYPGTTTVSTQSISLLTSTTGHSDTIGNYVLTGSDGSFSITGDYTCTANQQVYLYALGGNPGAGTNSAAGLMAILGNCPGTTFSASTYIWINEVSTIAAAYAFAGFATDATHVSSSGTTLAKVGIANAFANASNLELLSTGTALLTTPAGNGTVPQTTINTLANILASCVNSNGTLSGPTNATPCYTLFYNAQNPNATLGVPADTATAAINIAHNPGANIAALYGISTPATAFAPALNTQPNDLTISLNYTGGGLEAPFGIVIDSVGNAWVANGGNSTVTEFSSTGSPTSGTLGYSTGVPCGNGEMAIDALGYIWVANACSGNATVAKLTAMGVPVAGSPFATGVITNGPTGTQVAIDPSGSAWITNPSANSVSKLWSYGSPALNSPFTGGGLASPFSIAFDIAGDAWIADESLSAGTGGVTELNNVGYAITSSPLRGGGLTNSYQIVIDSLGNAWVTNVDANTVSKLTSTGIGVAGSPFTGGGLYTPAFIAIDGSGNAWVSNIGSAKGLGNSITELSSTGAAISGPLGFTESSLAAPQGIAIDGSGDVWVANEIDTVTEFIGAATPVVTPLVANLIYPYGAPASKP